MESWLPNLPPTVVRYLRGPHNQTPKPSELIWVELEQVALTDVRELWLDVAHYTGNATVRGRLKILPTQLLDTGPNEVTFHSGQVLLGDEPVLEGVTGRAALWIPTAMLASDGPAHALRAELELQARGDPSALSPLFPGVKISPSPAWLTARVGVEGGRLQQGSALRLWLPDLAVREGSLLGRAAAELALDTGGDGAALELSVRGLRFFRHGALLVTAPLVRAELVADALGLAGGAPPLLSLAVRLPVAKVESLAALGAQLPPTGPVALRGGSARASLSLFFPDVRELPGEGALRVAGSGAELSYTGVPVRADLDLVAPLSGVRLEPPAVRVNGAHLGLTHVKVGDEPRADWWGHVVVPKAALSAAGFAGEVEAELKDARPIIGLFAQANQVPGWTQGLLSVDGVKAAARVSVDAHGTGLDSLRVWGPGIQLVGRLRAGAEQTDGALLLRFRGLELGLELEEGKQKLILAGASQWFRTRGQDPRPEAGL